MVIEEEIINYWFTDLDIRKALNKISNCFENPHIKSIIFFPNFLNEDKVQQDKCLLFLSLYLNIEKDRDEWDRIKLTYDT